MTDQMASEGRCNLNPETHSWGLHPHQLGKLRCKDCHATSDDPSRVTRISDKIKLTAYETEITESLDYFIEFCSGVINSRDHLVSVLRILFDRSEALLRDRWEDDDVKAVTFAEDCLAKYEVPYDIDTIRVVKAAIKKATEVKIDDKV